MSKMNIVNTKLSISDSTRILEIPRGAGNFRAERENPARRGIKPARARFLARIVPLEFSIFVTT